MSAILEGLDSSQKDAVTCLKGPVLIVAGAGSGKTRVLTSRISYILEQGVEPNRIMALTFTKKAAEEMKSRIASMVGNRKARALVMGTFHSVFIRFLRDYSEVLGYPKTFTIYDTSDSISAIKSCLKEMKLDDKVYKPKDVLNRISMAKNNLVTWQMYKANTKAIINDTHNKKPEICNIYALYQQKMLQSGVMDFDDILLNLNLLIYNHKDIASEIAGRFDYVMVDEYQDTNFSQYTVLKRLCEQHRNLCVVGDDSQSIYAFRGAKIENILNFRKDYEDCHIFRLEQNYRSTKNIVNAANSVIEKNKGRIDKKCFSDGEDGDKIKLISAFTEQEEALLVASSIVSRMQNDKAAYSDFAILYRTNSQSRALEEALRKRNLPYMIYSGNSFFDRAEIKDMMAYLKLAVNPADDESFKRVVNKPARGIGGTTIDSLTTFAREKGLPLFQAIYDEKLPESGLKNPAINKLKAFGDIILKANKSIQVNDAYTVATKLADDSGLYGFFKLDKSIESQSRAANIEELMNSVKSFIEDRQNDFREEMLVDGNISDVAEISDEDIPIFKLDEYLENISLLSAVDVDDEDSNNKIKMMTVHSAKGLEFPYVYIVGMEEGLFPSGANFASYEEIEEERRLFYVALTRAKSAVSIAFAETRMRHGQHQSNPPSRFIREIDKQYIENPLPDDGYSNSQNYSGYNNSSFLGRNRNSSGNSYSRGGQNNYGRGNYSNYGNRNTNPSPSVQDLPSRFKPVSKAKPVANSAVDQNFEPVSVLELKEGQRIEHNRFGLGKILELTGSQADRKAKIEFDNFGVKILLLKYAKIRLER